MTGNYFCEANCHEYISQEQVEWQDNRNPITNDVQEKPVCPECGSILAPVYKPENNQNDSEGGGDQ